MIDRTVAKTLVKNEKVFEKLTFSPKYINILMAISLLKWAFILGLISFIIFIGARWEKTSRFIDISMLGMNQNRAQAPAESLENSLSADKGFQSLLSQAWMLPITAYILLISPLLLFYYQYYLRISNRYILTNSRLIFKRGWLSTEVESIHYDRITDVMVKQGFWQRFIFSAGNIYVNTAGGEDYEAKLMNIDDPHKIKKLIYGLKKTYMKNKYSRQDKQHKGKKN